MSYSAKIEDLLLKSTDAIIRRYETDRDYHFVDTKLDLINNRDFDSTDEWFKQENVIYNWIQGRGLEALAGHIVYFESVSDFERAAGLRKMLSEVTENMEKIRRRNGRRMFFMMYRTGKFIKIDCSGNPVKLDEIPEETNYSELFYAKGLLAAGAVLQNKDYFRSGSLYLRNVIDNILAENFATDQQMFDPANPVLFTPGKLLQGPKMIALGGTALGMKYGSLCNMFERKAIALLKLLFERYLAFEDGEILQQFDFFEAVDTEFRPYFDNDRIICDPGHGLEFAGLSLKNLMKFKSGVGLRMADKCRKFYARFMKHLFAIGYAPQAGGIIKSYDLVSRSAVNTDMPWWSLPETVRAAALGTEFTGDKSLLEIAEKCLAAFFDNYVRPEIDMMAIQTRNFRGEVVPVIPATPDADPGYHTNLSLIDALPLLRKYGL